MNVCSTMWLLEVSNSNNHIYFAWFFGQERMGRTLVCCFSTLVFLSFFIHLTVADLNILNWKTNKGGEDKLEELL